MSTILYVLWLVEEGNINGYGTLHLFRLIEPLPVVSLTLVHYPLVIL